MAKLSHVDQKISEVRDPNALYFDEPSLTQQHHRDECDINNILRKFSDPNAPVLDLKSLGRPFPGSYVDCCAQPEYREGLDTFRRLQAEFEALDAKTRDECQNDFMVYLEHLERLAQQRESEGVVSPQGSVEPNSSKPPSEVVL